MQDFLSNPKAGDEGTSISSSWKRTLVRDELKGYALGNGRQSWAADVMRLLIHMGADVNALGVHHRQDADALCSCKEE